MTNIRWERYPHVAAATWARAWLTIQQNVGLAEATVDAYGRGLQAYLAFCDMRGITPETATREHLAAYVNHLRSSPRRPRRSEAPPAHAASAQATLALGQAVGLSRATIRQRLVAVRLAYDYLIEEGQRLTNPVGRGRYTPGEGFGAPRQRGLVPTYASLPWIPTDTQWQAILGAASEESIRNRTMLALAYDAGLRREELCALQTADLDPAYRTLHVRAETSKGRRGRVLPYSATTGVLLMAYLTHRQELSRARGPLFLSESSRNRAAPITRWTWSKVVRRIALRAGVPQFSTHTLRHLCLTDLARSGWELHALATFAGHRNVATTLQYVHLSGRDLADKLTRGMAQLHDWRLRTLSPLTPGDGSDGIEDPSPEEDPLEEGQT